MAVLPATRIYEGTRIPSPVPDDPRDRPGRSTTSTTSSRINFGPNHPSTHGVLRLIVDLDGERIAGIRAVIGYLHTGFEKTMEHKTYWKGITYPERIDYLSFQANELVFVLAIEKLLALETPEKATWMRMCLAELNRIHSHLVWLGTSALEIGAISMFWYAFRERDMVLDLFEMVTGVRMHTRYFQVGGLAEDIPEGFYAQARALARHMPKAVDDYEGAARPQQDLARADEGHRPPLRRRRARARAVGPDAARLGRRLGPPPGRCRTSRYDEVDFDVPVYPNGDVYDRYKVHMDEMRTVGAHRRPVRRRASRSCAASRGSPTTARSCCRRARSSTPRWSR